MTEVEYGYELREEIDVGELEAAAAATNGRVEAADVEPRVSRAETANPLGATPPVDTAAWPAPPDEAAFFGLAGRITRLIEPHSEADPVALLAQILLVAGSLVGRTAYVGVEADRHYANFNVNLVGGTSKGRKGSSWGHAEAIARSVDVGFGDRVESGLSSGEGLIDRVRDAGVDDAEGEQPAADKRLVVVESEFANVLRVLERSGNRLSVVVRDAWDGRPLRTLTRGQPAKATGAHISIIGHITAEELRRYLTVTESANGFGNRFIWLSVRRSKALPDGGAMHKVNVADVVDELREAVRFAGTLGRVERDPAARDLWHAVYAELSEGRAGLVGALTGRAEAQVTRLSLVYALLDMATTIRVEHLRAALALWGYSARSVAHIFGSSLGDPVADTILQALQTSAPHPLTRTEIRTKVGGRVTGDEIDRALDLLARHRLARMQKTSTGGRPVEHWHFVGAKS